MAWLFGGRDSTLTAESAAAWLAAAENGAVFPGSTRTVTAGASLCAVRGGSVDRGDDGILAACVGFPRWKAADLAALARDQNPAAALVEAYRRRGGELWREVGGAFSLAVIDPARDTVVLVMDRIGQRHLYYAQTAGGLIFGTSARALLAHPEVASDIHLQAVFDYVYSHHCPSPGSIYRDIRKLDGAEVLVYQAGNLQIQRYWQPEFHEESRSLKTLSAELHDALRGAVAGYEGRVGAFLSGGLDSSTVAGVLAQARPGAAETFSMGFAVPGYDEMEYARIAARHFQTHQHEYYLTPDEAVAAIPQIAAAYDEPFGNSSALPTYFCARMAREQGIELLLGGDGGDELFAGNTRYATQLLFEPYGRIPGGLRTSLEAGLSHLPGSLAGFLPFRKLRRYVEQAKTPLPDRLHDYNYMHRLVLGAVFAPEFLAAVDSEAPLAEQRRCYQRPAEASTLNRMLYLDWKTTLHDNDLVKVNSMCDLAGVSVAYPMLDDAVLDLSCRVPSRLKLRQGRLRWFYKKAMVGFLPQEILTKSKHGFGLPFGIWLREHAPLRELAYDHVTALKQRPYFRPDFLDEAIRMHQTGHAAYYGELIWVLMMLELWFAAGR